MRALLPGSVGAVDAAGAVSIQGNHRRGIFGEWTYGGGPGSIAAQSGLRVRAAWLSSSGELPVPSIIHLSSEHFVAVRERRGAFYQVYDRALLGTRWLTVSEILREASGCVIVSDVVPPAG